MGGHAPVVRAFQKDDTDAVWRIFAAVVATGETYVFPPEISREEALGIWLGGDCYVACVGGEVVGTSVVRANQMGLGDHVANASYMVDPGCQGRGIGRLLAEHSLGVARAAGFRAMQFNFVVASNEPAVRLWQSLGFAVVGRLPGAFYWKRERYVDGLVMFRSLMEGAPEPLLGLTPRAEGSCPPDDGLR